MSSPRPEYVYVASSWRNPVQPAVVAILTAAGIPNYDFRNPEAGTGFSWAEVKPITSTASITVCQNCGQPIAYGSFTGLGFYEPDVDPDRDPEIWRHARNGYAACTIASLKTAIPKKGSDWERVEDYLAMLAHPRAVEGFNADFAAMKRADTFVMVLPCGKSAHLELGWAIGAGKRTAILLEDPVEPELMYLCADFITPSIDALLAWMGV